MRRRRACLLPWAGVQSSLRNRLLLTFVALVVVAGAGTLFVVERTLAEDLTATLVKARVGELTEQRDLLSVVFANLVEGVVVVGRDREVALINEAARPLVGDGRALPAALAPLVQRALAGEQADDELALVGRSVRPSSRCSPPATASTTSSRT